MKVKSLSQTIVVQFAVILLPMIAVVLYQVGTESRRAANMAHAMSLHEAAARARERYAIFVNGATDAVDTGQLAPTALAAHRQAAVEIDQLVDLGAPEPAMPAALSRELHATQAALQRNASLPALMQLRQPIGEARVRIDRLYAEGGRQFDAAVESSLQGTERTREIVLALSCILGILTVVFIRRMIRNLLQPLRLAVSVENRIASGDKFDTFTVDPRRDIDNLLGSLQHMHTSLCGFEEDVERKRIGLEQKILSSHKANKASARRSARRAWVTGSGRSAALPQHGRTRCSASWASSAMRSRRERALSCAPFRPPNAAR